jgi:hypothetical protein
LDDKLVSHGTLLQANKQPAKVEWEGKFYLGECCVQQSLHVGTNLLQSPRLNWVPM